MDLLLLVVLTLVIFVLLLQGAIDVTVRIVNKINNARLSKRARIEAELDRKQAELSATILDLASHLGAEAHEARKALIRESFLTSRDDYPRGR